MIYKFLLLFFALTISSDVFSSVDSICYYNIDWEETIKDSAYYYRKGLSRDGIFYGAVTDYYMSGKVQMKGYYANGIEHGEFIWYHEDGKLKERGNYDRGLYRIKDYYDSNGNQLVRNGKGKRILYYENGDKMGEEDFLWGYLKGDFIFWFRGGKIKEKGKIKKNGIALICSYDSNGNIQVSDGTGDVKQYFLNGQIKADGCYINGFKQNLWSFYYENGKLKEKGSFRKGKKDGLWEYFYDNGNKWASDSFERGRLIKTIFYTEDFKRGEIIKFEEYFTDNVKNWIEEDNDSVFLKIEHGKYYFQTKAKNTSWSSWLWTGRCNIHNFSIKTGLSISEKGSNNGGGLIWGIKDNMNFYEFLISPDGTFAVNEMINGLEVPIVPRSIMPESGSSYELEVKREGRELIICINSKIVGISKFRKYNGRGVGFLDWCGSPMEIDFLKIVEY